MPLSLLSHLKKYDCDETQRNKKYLLHSIQWFTFRANLQALIYIKGARRPKLLRTKNGREQSEWQPRKMGPAASSLYKNGHFWCTLSGFYKQQWFFYVFKNLWHPQIKQALLHKKCILYRVIKSNCNKWVFSGEPKN